MASYYNPDMYRLRYRAKKTAGPAQPPEDLKGDSSDRAAGHAIMGYSCGHI